MKIVQYEYIVKARVQLTAAEVYHLIDQSLSHYDHKCKSAARPGFGGFLNAFKNTIGADGTSTQFLSAQELDLLGKILEGPGADIGLREAVRECWRALRDEAMGTDRVMRAVRDQAPFTEPEADNDSHHYVYVSLALEQIQLARHLIRLIPLASEVPFSDQCVSLGVLSAYLDDYSREAGSGRDLNARELRALISVVQGNSLQVVFQEALDRLQAQTKDQP